MKKIGLIFFLILLNNWSFNARTFVIPQDSTTKIVDKTAALLLMEEGKASYLEGKYKEALNKFRLAYNKDQNNFFCSYWIGITHFKMNNFGYALQYGKQAEEIRNAHKKSNDDEQNVDVAELLGSAYHRLNKIDSALIYYTYTIDKLSKQRLKDLRINERIAECNYVLGQVSENKVSKRKLLPSEINSGYHEYAPILTNSGKTLYFTSRRENTTGGQNNPDDEQYFEDNYRAKWNNEDQIWDSVNNKLDRINSDGFDCISFISEDGLSGLMTLNSTESNQKVKTSGSDICEITLTNKGKWATPKLIKNKSINTSFFDGAATMTADGNTMYFVSDRNGAKNMLDIYEVKKVGNEWGKAVPVSDSINTEMRETTPFITPDGQFLFFSSEGHLGMGGYDIYVSENLGKTWSKPINLGAEINSVNDDTHLQFYPKLKKIVFASSTFDKLKSSMDIYEIDLNDFKLPIKE
jgi:tetratricopeptide (TPR) repeat protein